MDNFLWLQTKNTKTGGLFPCPVINVSTFTGDYTIFLRVINLIGTVRFAINDSLDGFATEGLPGPAFSMKGGITPDNPVIRSFSRRDFPSLRLGTASASIRLILMDVQGDATKTVTFESWMQYAS